jgi:hypothetical protein
MESLFFNNDFNQILRINVISDLYPLMIQPHKEILLKYLRQLVLVVSMIYNFNKPDLRNIFFHELCQNNYQDLKWLCSFLLNHLELQKEIKSLDEIYTKKVIDIDINLDSPKYVHSNLQYGRCIRGDVIKEIDFSEEHIRQNFILLISSLIESSHKLYVNWIDVLPLTLSNYSKTDLYENTFNFMRNRDLKEFDKFDINDIQLTENNSKRLHSIQISDIYNVIRNYLYEDIVPLKLLIYDLINELNTELIPAIVFFKEYFNEIIGDMIEENPWNILEQDKKIYFQQKLLNLFEHAKKNIYLFVTIYKNGDNYSLKISSNSIQRLVKAMAITFDNTYRLVPNVINTGYVPIKKEIDENEIDDERVYDANSVDDLIPQLDSINPQFMYEHLRKMIEKLKYTVYGAFIFDAKKKTILDRPTLSEINPELNFRSIRQITLKNIYNFAKSLSRYQKEKDYPAYPKHWKSLEKNEKQVILDRLNSKILNGNWFNIKRYIRYILKELKQDTSSINIDRYNTELYKFISETYLSEIVFKSLIFKGVLSELKPNKLLTDTTITKRSERGDILSKMNRGIFSYGLDNPYSNAYSYLSELPYIFSGNIPDANKSGWFSLYALDWVSQIGFCHRYINQRVSYITGATGVGKSTQVPKLFMYYLKAIDYNSTGRVVCTQPRKAPTKKNAEQVSKELGFPIFENNIDTEYYFVQMHHKTQKHIANVSHLFLKYITDGTLVQEFKNVNPMLKKYNNDKSISNQNAYDIIIIDEAHEHGKNMDVLLTLMRDFCYFNPSIKLVILSATMDDDEPVYRRYYRDINDNQKYPIDCNIRDNNLDRINIDRRYHISPVGLGTTHKIEETYMADTSPVDIVRMLVREGLKGDILIFQPGEGDIVKLVEELNENTPDDIIALPFYSALSDDKKSFIEDIDRTFPSLRISKKDNYAKVTDLTKGNGSYKNCIICSTNIAEASITIRRLFYVIETGTRKGLIYSYTRRVGKLTTMDISESSRLQRKGRVGRTGPGHVYYTYKKGRMENNKILFEFGVSNISDSIFSTIQEKVNEELITLNNLLKDKKLFEQFYNLYNTNKGRFTYEGDKNLYDYDYSDKYYPKMYETGYDSITLYDAKGEFYIVHPEELYIKRNIMGRVISSIRNDVIIKNNTIESYKINSFFEDLFMKKFLDLESNKFYRTQFGKLINEIIISNSCFEDQNLAEILSYSVFFNTSDDMCRIMSMIGAISGNVLTMFDSNEKMVYNLLPFKKMFKSSSSEFEVLNDLGKEIIKFIFNDININEIDLAVMKMFKLNPNEYYDIIDNFKNIEMEEDGKRRKNVRGSIYSVRVNLILTHPKLKGSIQTFCKLININPSFVKGFLELYLTSTDSIKALFFPNQRDKNYTNDINKYKKMFEEELKQDYNPILLNLLHAMPFNIAKRIIPTKHFLGVYSPSSDNIYTLDMYKQKQQNGLSFEPLLLISNEFATNYVFYFGINILRESIVFLSYLDKKYLKLFPRIYNFDRLNKIGSNEFQKLDRFYEKLESKQIPKQIAMEDIRTLEYVSSTYKEMLREMP